MNCTICCEKVSKLVCCPSCEKGYCPECIVKYCESVQDIKCMETKCKKEWNLGFVSREFKETFMERLRKIFKKKFIEQEFYDIPQLIKQYHRKQYVVELENKKNELLTKNLDKVKYDAVTFLVSKLSIVDDFDDILPFKSMKNKTLYYMYEKSKNKILFCKDIV
jgi:hypothetical protein